MSAVTETATARWLPRWTPYLVLLIPLAVALWTLRAVLQNYTPAPFFDYWENFYWWRHLVENGRLPDGFFFSQHNEHRILLPRLVYFADIKWFGGTNILPHLGTAAVQLAAAALFIKAAGLRSLRWPGLLGLTASLCLVLWAAQWENLLWPFQIQFVAVYAAGAWAIHLFSLAAADRDRLRLDVMAAALVVLAVATFNMASGVFAGVAMVLVAVCGRLGWRAALAAGAATAVLLTVYLIGYKPTPHPAPPEDSFLTLYPSYLLAFLGNVWAFGRPEWSIAFGLVVAGLTAAMVAVVWFGKVRDPARLTMLGIVLFIGMAAGVTTLGRLGYGIDQALSSRYQTPVSYLWAAHALFWGLTLCRVERAWWKALAAAPLVVALIFVIPVQNRGLRELSWLREYVALGSSALVGGIDDDKALLRLYPEARRVREFRPFLRSHGLGLFADDPGFQVGSLLPRDRLVEPQACAGAFDVLDPDPGGGASWRALGWAWDLQQRRRFDRILIVDAAGVVAGVAVGKIRRDDVAKHRGDVKTHSAGWAGLVQPRPGQELTAYGVRRGGTLCELGRKAPAA